MPLWRHLNGKRLRYKAFDKFLDLLAQPNKCSGKVYVGATVTEPGYSALRN